MSNPFLDILKIKKVSNDSGSSVPFISPYIKQPAEQPVSPMDSVKNFLTGAFAKTKNVKVPTITKPKVVAPMEFKVGEGLNEEQTKTAYEKISNPDTAMKEGQDNQFLNILKNNIVKEFSPRTEAVPIRRPFEITPIETKAPPIVTQLGSLGFGIIEAIPKMAATLGGEFKAGFKSATVKSNIDLRRLGFDTPDYVTAAKEQQDAINNGENPWLSGLRIVSDKGLSIAFGASLVSDLAKLSTSILLKGGVEARIEAQNVIDAYKQNVSDALKRLKESPSSDWSTQLANKEKTLSDLANTRKLAQKVIDEQGAPTAIDRARVNASRYTEVLGRQTPITKNIFSDILKPDYNLKNPIKNTPLVDPKLLPGTRERPGQAPAFGLSTKEVENVGYGAEKGVSKIVDDITTPEGVAKKLIRSYVERGETLSQLQAGYLGQGGNDFSAMIVSGGKIKITKIGDKEVDYTVSLKKAFDEIKTEQATGKAIQPPKDLFGNVIKTEPKKLTRAEEHLKKVEEHNQRVGDRGNIFSDEPAPTYDISPELEAKANTEWENNPQYGEKVGVLADEVSTLEKELKTLKDKLEIAKIQSKIDAKNNEINNINETFAQKWQKESTKEVPKQYETALEKFQKGDSITAVSKTTGKKSKIQFISSDKVGIMAKEPTTGLPMRFRHELFDFTKADSGAKIPILAKKSVKPTTSSDASTRYYNEVLKPKIDKGEALVIGADDLKYHFGNDFDPKNHAIYSKATNELYEKLVKEIKNPLVKFSIGGTGSGKSNFIIPDASENFNGIIYDSTGWNYEGIKKQIQFAYDNNKSVELYGVIPDIEKTRAYTFKREAEGKHPVSEEAFIRTHVGAIDTMKKLINDGVDVYTLDTRGKTIEDIQTHDYKLNDIDTLNSLEYNEVYVKEQTQKVTSSNHKEIIAKREGSIGKILGGSRIFPQEKLTPNLSQIDQLIADNKIRVVSRGNRDVYQFKKGDNWVNARDEDSAIHQVTKEPYQPKPKVYSPKDQEKLDGTKAMLENVRERLAEHPGKKLIQLIDRKEGQIEDFRNPNYAKNEKEAQRIIAKNEKMTKIAMDALQDNPLYSDKFDNVDALREVLDDYRGAREVEKSLVATKNELLETLKPIDKTISLEKILPKSSPVDTTTGEGRSIELQAQQALEVLGSEPFPINVSLPTIIENTVTHVKQKVHFIDTFLRTPHFVMEKIGFGKEAVMLRDAMDSYWKELPKNIDVITKWSKEVSKDGNKDIFRFLDGEAITLKPQDKKVALEIKDWLKEWAVKLKLPEDNQISHYITHIFEQELITKEFDEELAKIIADKIPGQVYDPFLLKRLGKKGYRQDTWAALDAYVKRGTRKVHMDPVLEIIQDKAGVSLEYSNIEKSQFNYIKKYVDNINMRPSEAEEGIDNFVKSIIGYKFGQRPVIAALKFFRQATFRGMLGLNPASALRNLSQGINTYAVLKEKYTTIGYLKLFSRGAGEELAREGVLNAGFVQDRALNATKKAIEKVDKVLFAFFDTAEKINRGSAYFGGKAKALAEGKSEADAIKYAKGVVRQTQFIFDSIDTPVGMSSQIMKTVTQFQTFTTKQIEFLTNMAREKNFTGLLRYALAGVAFVYTIGRAFGMDPKELLPWYRFDTPPSLKFPVEVTKAVFNTPDKYNQPRSLDKKLGDIGNSAIGLIPAGSQIKKTIQGIQAINEGGSFDKGGKLQFSQGQSFSEKAQSFLFGKYASDEAQNYFNKSEITAKEFEKIKPIYDQAKTLIKDGKDTEAQTLVDQLTEEEYALYKKYRTSEITKATVKGKKDILPKYLEIQKLKETDPAKAQAEVDTLSDDEYKYYELVKKQIEKDQKANAGEKPTYTDGEAQTEQGIVGTVFTYAKALGTDPVTAFNRIFTGQIIRRVDNGAIIVNRMPFMASTKVKAEKGFTGGSMKLDHTLPLSLGGSNSEDNLKLVTEAQWSSYTPVENYLGKKLRDGKLEKKEVQDLITKFKNGEMTAQDVYDY